MPLCLSASLLGLDHVTEDALRDLAAGNAILLSYGESPVKRAKIKGKSTTPGKAVKEEL